MPKVVNPESASSSITDKDRTKDVSVINDGTYDRLAANVIGTVTATMDKTKIWDGTYIAKVDSQQRLYVYIPPSIGNTTIQLLYEKSEVPAATGQYMDVVSYTVPTGYDLNCIHFDGLAGVNNSEARAINRIAFGSFVLSTGVYTDGSAWTTPKFASKIYLYVTTGVGATNDTITVTYTNQAGTAGRTGSVILKSNDIGERIEVPLQSGDYGALDVTNVTQSFVEAGAVNVEGCFELFYEALTTVNTAYKTTAPLSSIVVVQGDTIILQYASSNESNVSRRVSLVGALVPR